MPYYHELFNAQNIILDAKAQEIDEVVISTLHEIKKDINETLKLYDNRAQLITEQMVNCEFDLVSVEQDGLLFRRLIDDKDFVFIKEKDFDYVIRVEELDK